MRKTNLCCPDCFGDRGLSDSIIPSLTTELGVCGFCGSIDVLLVDPRQLVDYFEMLISIYVPDDNGKTLVQLMKEDWCLFGKMDEAHAKELLGEILDDGQKARKRFSVSPAYVNTGMSQWDDLRNELLYKNRYFPDASLDSARISELFNHLIARDVPDVWYRARIQTEDQPYTVANMGPPPSKLTSHGRANPVGIPYLYLGSAPETAVAEVRPHTGDIACVAEFQSTKKIIAVDLRNPRATVSPFLLENMSEIGQLRADIPFLEKIGYELTKPVLPRSAAIDYIPSQYLCELIKKSGFNGVLYKSSISEGYNLVLFDIDMVTALKTNTYKVNKVAVDVALL